MSEKLRERLLLTQAEAARVLGVNPKVIYAAVEAGQLPTVVLGKRRLIPLPALEELVNVGKP